MFIFVLFKDKKKALAMTIAMGALLAIFAATILPIMISSGLFKQEASPRYKKTEALATDFYADTEAVIESRDNLESRGEAMVRYGGESWVEYSYTYKQQQYTFRKQENVSVYEYRNEYRNDTLTPVGHLKLLYVNTANPGEALEYPPEKKTNMAVLPWLAMSPIALLFVITLVNYLSVAKKEKAGKIR
ncbi:MAG: DUF3592 domain-containing protein [Oscillospiraceae bacterium]|nr:DUF3592 domain-containing protein [Oscillospiraceae bacterium]